MQVSNNELVDRCKVLSKALGETVTVVKNPITMALNVFVKTVHFTAPDPKGSPFLRIEAKNITSEFGDNWHRYSFSSNGAGFDVGVFENKLSQIPIETLEFSPTEFLRVTMK